MPESATLPEVLRRGLSQFEQNVLLFAQRGGVKQVRVELLRSRQTEAEAQRIIDDTKAKAAKLIAAAAASNGGGRRGMADCKKHGEYTDRGRGCPACTTAPEGGGERRRPSAEPKAHGPSLPDLPPTEPRRPSRRKREEQREAGRRGSAGRRLPERPLTEALLDAAGEDRVPDPEEGGTMGNGAGGTRPPAGTAPPTQPPAPSSSSPAPPADPPPANPDRLRTMPKRAPGELRRQALDIIREHGPIRQAEVRTRLGIDSPQMAGLVRQIESQLVVGELVERSPLLSIREEPAPEPEATAPEAPEPEAPAPEEVAEPEAPEERELSLRERGLLADIRSRVEASQRESARIGAELMALGEEMAVAVDAALPETLLRARYLAALLKCIERGNTEPELLDRFERLAGIADS